MATLILPVVGQDSGTWGTKVNNALEALNSELVATTRRSLGAVTDGAQTWNGVKTFASRPVVPDATFGVAKIAAAGTRSTTTYLCGDGSWSEPAGSGTGDGSASSNALGSLNNPVTDAAAPRPTGLTRVVWDTATDPTNWITGDYNLQSGI